MISKLHIFAAFAAGILAINSTCVLASDDDSKKLPPWTPYMRIPAPVSLNDAWGYVHAEANQIPKDTPLWFTYVELRHTPRDSSGHEWSYRFYTNFAVIRDGRMYSEQVVYSVLMDGSEQSTAKEIPGALIPPGYVNPYAHPRKVPPAKVEPKTVPETVRLLTVKTTTKGQSVSIPYTITRAQFLALPTWDFSHGEPPPLSLDDALALVRQNVATEWPGEPWEFSDIRLVNGKSPESGHTCFYVFTVLHKSNDERTKPATLTLQIVLMDGTLIDTDPALPGSMGRGISW